MQPRGSSEKTSPSGRCGTLTDEFLNYATGPKISQGRDEYLTQIAQGNIYGVLWGANLAKISQSKEDETSIDVSFAHRS